MAHYKVIAGVHQSEGDGRLDNIPAGLLDRIKAFNGTAVVAWDPLDYGPTGNGTAWVSGSSSNNRYSWALIGISNIADYLNEDIVCVNTSMGGSRLKAVGNNDANGCWNTDYGAIPGGVTQLTAEFDGKWSDWLAYCSAGSHTFELLFILRSHGHADDSHPYNYVTDCDAWDAELRAIVGEPNCHILNLSIPHLSSQFNKKIRAHYLSRQSDINHVFDATNYALVGGVDVTHIGYDGSEAAGAWVLDVFQKIENPPVPVAQPSNRSIFNQAIASIAEPDRLAKFLSKGAFSAGEQIAAEWLLDALETAGLLHKYAAIWPLLGGTAELQSYNLINADIRRLGFGGTVAHGTKGPLPDGVNGYISTGIRITDIPMLKSTNFGVGWFTRNSIIGADVVAASFKENGSTNSVFRVWPSRPGSSNKMRMDVGGAGFALESTSAMTFTGGLSVAQTRTTNAEIYREGIKVGSKAFATDFNVNGFLVFSYDDLSGSRFMSAEYQTLFLRQDLSEADCLVEANIFNVFNEMLSRAFTDRYQAVLDKADELEALNPGQYTKPVIEVQRIQNALCAEGESSIALDNVTLIWKNEIASKGFSNINWADPDTFLSDLPADITHNTNGYLPNGTSQFVSTNFNCSTDGGGKYTQDSASRWIYITVLPATVLTLDGCINTAGRNRMNSQSSSTTIKINQGAGNLSLAVDLTGLKYKALDRPDNTNVNAFNVKVKTSVTAASAAMTNEEQVVFRSGAANWGDPTALGYGIGGSKSDAIHNLWSDALDRYDTKINAL
jgi:hypothetical protein